MAERLIYITKPARMPTARDELEELIETLSSSGAFRVINGLVGRFPQVADVALEEANSPAGRHLIGMLALIGQVFTKLPARKLEGVAKGIDRGIDEAAEALRHDPPSTFQLLKLAKDPEVRRSLAAMFSLLKEIGHELSEEERERAENSTTTKKRSKK